MRKRRLKQGTVYYRRDGGRVVTVKGTRDVTPDAHRVPAHEGQTRDVCLQ